MTNFCFVGNTCIDKINNQPQTEGGASLYGAALAVSLMGDVAVITSCAKDFPIQKYPKVNWNIQVSASTTMYEHTYQGNDRKLTLVSQADPIEPAKIPDRLRKSEIVMLCPIVHEVTPELVAFFDSEWIGLCPQGWFRFFDDHGKMKHTQSKYRLFKKIKLIVVSHDDISQDHSAWNWIQQSAEVAVSTMGKEGYILTMNGIEKMFKPRKIFDSMDSTGCGDIFSTSLLYLLHRGLSPVVAAENAGYAGGLASTQKGILDSVTIASEYLISLEKN